MPNSHIVVVGSSNTDIMVKLDRIPRPGETVLGGEFFSAAGGKGANQAVGATRAGGTIAFVTRVGDDLMGRQTLAGLRREGIDVRWIRGTPAAPTGVALILVAKNGQNSIGVAPGANLRLAPTDVIRAKSAFSRADVLLAQLEIPLKTVMAAVNIARGAGMLIVLNPAPARPLPDALLAQVSVITPNETEAEALTGIKVSSVASARLAADRLRRRGARTVVVTLGSRGALVADDEGKRVIRGFRVKVRDTTAAGDIFNGALAVALAEQKSLDDAVRFANAAAALSVTKIGAQPSAPSRQQIERLLRTRAVMPHLRISD